jgi:hypothetical protein
MSNQYAFVTHWRVEGTCGEVADVLGDPLDLPRWWPSVYLHVEELRPPDANAALVGGAVAVGASLAYLMLRARRKNH